MAKYKLEKYKKVQQMDVILWTPDLSAEDYLEKVKALAPSLSAWMPEAAADGSSPICIEVIVDTRFARGDVIRKGDALVKPEIWGPWGSVCNIDLEEYYIAD